MQWLERRSWLAYGGFAALTVLWVQTVGGIYSDSGLFWWVGTDFAQYYAQSMALWSGDPSNIYRPQSYNTLYQELLRTYIVNQQPVPPTSVPYPPIFAWLFSPFTIPSPPIGFALWETLFPYGTRCSSRNRNCFSLALLENAIWRYGTDAISQQGCGFLVCSLSRNMVASSGCSLFGRGDGMPWSAPL
jgi:hypothetical protein